MSGGGEIQSRDASFFAHRYILFLNREAMGFCLDAYPIKWLIGAGDKLHRRGINHEHMPNFELDK